MLDDCFRPDGTPLISAEDIAALARAYIDNDRAALDAVLAKYPRDNAGAVYRQFEREEQVIGLVHNIASYMALAPAVAGGGLQQFLIRHGIRPDLAAAAQQVFRLPSYRPPSTIGPRLLPEWRRRGRKCGETGC